jgi:hypothetical protein
MINSSLKVKTPKAGLSGLSISEKIGWGTRHLAVPPFSESRLLLRNNGFEQYNQNNSLANLFEINSVDGASLLNCSCLNNVKARLSL